MQIEPPQHFLGAGQHALVLVLAVLGRRDRDQFDLGELVLADHAAGIAPGRPRLGAKTRRQRRQPHRQFFFVEDGFANEVCQRDFGGGDEPVRSELQLDRSILARPRSEPRQLGSFVYAHYCSRSSNSASEAEN